MIELEGRPGLNRGRPSRDTVAELGGILLPEEDREHQSQSH